MANIRAADGELDQTGGKHGIARRLAEDALRLQAAGQVEEAERLMAQAQHTDPEAVVDVLQENQGAFGGDALDNDTGDRAVERITATPSGHADAPPRANITGPGSGADKVR